MIKIIILKAIELIILLVFIFSPVNFVKACDDCNYTPTNNAPTSAGNVIRTNCWNCDETASDTVIIATYEDETETIDSSNSVVLKANSGSEEQYCGPYTWSTSSVGYSLSDTITNIENDTITLSVIGGTCITNGVGDYAQVAVVSVTDCRGKVDTIEIRHSEGD